MTVCLKTTMAASQEVGVAATISYIRTGEKPSLEMEEIMALKELKPRKSKYMMTRLDFCEK